MRVRGPCCDLGPGEGAPPDADGLVRYTDTFGFRYQLCQRHYENLLRVLVRHEGFRVAPHWRDVVVPAEPPRRSSGHRRPAPPGAVEVTAEEQRRAREQAGWSLRELARAMDRSRSQLQAAEQGRRPVDPVVAVWVRSVLDGVAA